MLVAFFLFFQFGVRSLLSGSVPRVTETPEFIIESCLKDEGNLSQVLSHKLAAITEVMRLSEQQRSPARKYEIILGTPLLYIVTFLATAQYGAATTSPTYTLAESSV